MVFSGRHFALTDYYRDEDASDDYPTVDRVHLRSFLSKCPQGMFVTAHARFHPALVSALEDLDLKHVFLIRDPRDVAVSHGFYVQKETRHPQHDHYTNVLTSDGERLMATIHSFKTNVVDGIARQSSFDTLAGSLPWLAHSSTLVVRFEDLIGPRGGGDERVQRETIRQIGDFVGRPLRGDQAVAVAQKMYGKQSSTFRKGQVGDWHNHFSEEHVSAFKDIMGDRLIALGYEQDMDW